MILGDLQRARLVNSQRVPRGRLPAGAPAVGVSIARVMRDRRALLADVHGQRPEAIVYPSAAAELASVWVAAREAYRRVLDQVTLADVVTGKLPAPVAELIATESAWYSFGDVPAN